LEGPVFFGGFIFLILWFVLCHDKKRRQELLTR